MSESSGPLEIAGRSDACRNRALSATDLAKTTLEKRLARFRSNEARARAAGEKANAEEIRRAMNICADSWKMLAHHVEVLIEEGAASSSRWHAGMGS